MTDKSRNGISLVEIIIALGLLAMIMLPIFITFSASHKNIDITDSEFKAQGIALELMEQVISLPFQLIPVEEFTPDKIKSGQPMGSKYPIKFNVTEIKGFKPRLKIEKIEKNGRVKFKKITVIVSFPKTKTSRKKREVTLKTLIANETN